MPYNICDVLVLELINAQEILYLFTCRLGQKASRVETEGREGRPGNDILKVENVGLWDLKCF